MSGFERMTPAAKKSGVQYKCVTDFKKKVTRTSFIAKL